MILPLVTSALFLSLNASWISSWTHFEAMAFSVRMSSSIPFSMTKAMLRLAEEPSQTR